MGSGAADVPGGTCTRYVRLRPPTLDSARVVAALQRARRTHGQRERQRNHRDALAHAPPYSWLSRNATSNRATRVGGSSSPQRERAHYCPIQVGSATRDCSAQGAPHGSLVPLRKRADAPGDQMAVQCEHLAPEHRSEPQPGSRKIPQQHVGRPRRVASVRDHAENGALMFRLKAFGRQDDGGASFCLAPVGKWKRNDHHTPWTISRHTPRRRMASSIPTDRPRRL